MPRPHEPPWLALVALVALGAACTATPAQSPPSSGPPHPLVHRFEHAEHWAREFDDPARDAWQRPAEVIRLMQIEPGMAVADIGAGSGYFEPWLSRAVGTQGVVLALDIEQDMVRYLGERAERQKLANVHPKLVIASDPELAPGSVDRILIVDTWHHISEREAYARKLYAALNDRGRVFIVDFKLDARHGPPREYRLSPERVSAELAAGGLSATLLDAPLSEQYVIAAAR